VKKLLYFIIPFTIASTLGGCYSPGYVATSTPVEPSISYNDFYGALSPYGRWIDYPAYGRVWICNEAGFRPYYSGGHWAYTSYGWTWVSTYNWGWAPFHYGRWFFDPMYGWLWMPGNEWAPAWVSWRQGGDVYGWAPLHPGINITEGYSYNAPPEEWVFVPHQHITSITINNYYINKTQNVTYISNTTVINNTNVYRNTRYVSGPQKNEVERMTGRPVDEWKFREMNNPGAGKTNKGELAVYRPFIKHDNSNPSTSTTGNNGSITNEVKQNTLLPAENKSVGIPVNGSNNNPPVRNEEVKRMPELNHPKNNETSNNNGTITNEVKQDTRRPMENKSVELPASRTVNNPQVRNEEVKKMPEVNNPNNNRTNNNNQKEGEEKNRNMGVLKDHNKNEGKAPNNNNNNHPHEEKMKTLKPANNNKNNGGKEEKKKDSN